MRGLFIIAAWLYLHRPLLAWFGRTFSHTDLRLNACLLLGALGLLAWRLRAVPRRELSLQPRSNWSAIGLASALAVIGLASRRFLDVQMIEGPLFILGSWALIGLFVPASSWRRGLVPALVFVAVLPFGAQADAYAGFMARVLSAKAAAAALGTLGVPSMSAETVLIFENGVAQIDAPCSGLRSLWMGGFVFLLALWIEGHRLGGRALLGGALLVALLIGANISRVTIIVLLAVVLGQPELAEVVHVPVGLVGFLLAAFIPLVLLRGASVSRVDLPRTSSAAPLSRSVALALGLAFAVLGGLASSRPAIAAAPTMLQLDLDPSWRMELLPLSPAEEDLLGRFAGGRVAKLRVSDGNRAAAVLLVESTSWRSHHPPELCLAGSGHRLSEVREHAIAPEFVVRFARLDEGERLHVSWFQAGADTHPDLVDRIIAGVFGRRRAFVMVSIVLEGMGGPRDPAFVSFLTMLRDEIARSQQEPTS